MPPFEITHLKPAMLTLIILNYTLYLIHPIFLQQPQGAHLLLRLRIKTLNNDLRKMFTQWYPQMDQEN